MSLPKVGFLRRGQLQVFGFPAQRTLENRMRGGVIRLGGDVPPLRTLRRGGARVVAIAELTAWLRATGGLEPDEAFPAGRLSAASGADEDLPARRGRPRKGKAGRVK